MPEIIVISGGVIGLSSALALQQRGHTVQLITRELPQDTTSAAAGAIWAGGGLAGRMMRWAEGTLQRLLALCQEPGSGVTLQRVRRVFPHAQPDDWFAAQLPFYARIPIAQLPAGSQAGMVMDLPIVAPPRYLQRLHEQFLAEGGVFDLRHIDSLDELLDEVNLVVNCSGVGARRLADDPAVQPIRGQTLLVDGQIGSGYMDESAFTYLFPRDDGILLGGTQRAGDWRREVDKDESADILARCGVIEPGLASATVLRSRVGLRPGRHAVRLEAERRNQRRIIHNYGHGGIGFTLSWGCALAVARLAEDCV
ncbi:MAG: FAD-binding oxidoreductase [Chloroflexi bacterium]|nr:FAD-binding oxidoreductase [Chloroflexota bacterium]